MGDAKYDVTLVPNGFESNFTTGFARGLQDNHIRVLVASDFDSEPRLNELGIANQNLLPRAAAVSGTLQKGLRVFRYHIGLIRMLVRHRRARVHFSGVFRNSRVLYEGLALSFCFRLFSRRYVYTAHNVLPHGKENSRLFALAYRLIYRFPHRILVHTERARSELIERFGVPAGKLVLTSIGLNEEIPESALTREDARTSLGIAQESRAILFFGKAEPYKGLERLLDAFGRIGVGDARLVIAGAFLSPAYRSQILDRIERSPRKADILVHEGHIPNERVEVYFKACDALCLPYHHIYQSGLVFLAPRFGLPMVTTPVGELKQFVEGAGMGLVTDTNDANGLVRSLEAFFQRQNEFSPATIRARGAQYRWCTVCRALVPLYRDADASTTISS